MLLFLLEWKKKRERKLHAYSNFENMSRCYEKKFVNNPKFDILRNHFRCGIPHRIHSDSRKINPKHSKKVSNVNIWILSLKTNNIFDSNLPPFISFHIFLVRFLAANCYFPPFLAAGGPPAFTAALVVFPWPPSVFSTPLMTPEKKRKYFTCYRVKFHPQNLSMFS